MLNKERNYGIDCLRVISMFMVVLLHVLGRGGVLQATKDLSINYGVSWFLEIAAYCAVNCYAIISGYVGYGRKIKYSNLIYLIFCVAFYIILITVLGCFFVPNISLKEIVKSLLHMRWDGYWYVKAYFCAFFFFPYVNFIVEKLEEKSLYRIAGGMFILFSVIPTLIQADVFSVKAGYSPLWLMIMYFVGAVLKKFDVEPNGEKRKYLFLYIIMVVLTFISKLGIAFVTQKLFNREILSGFLVSYISPTIVFSGIFLVAFFSKVHLNKIATKIVSVMSPLTFGVYLIHTQYFAWNYLNGKFVNFSNMNPILLFVSVILPAFAIYLLCSFVDYIRQGLFKIFKIKRVSEKLERNLLDKTDKFIIKK